MPKNNIKRLLIFGAGEGGRELLKVIIDDINKVSLQWQVLGFIDKDSSKKEIDVYGYQVIGSKYDGDPKDIFGICGVMNNEIRQKIINEEIIGKGFNLATLIHPSVAKVPDFVHAPGLIIYPGSKISYNVRLGRGIMVNYNCVLGHDLVVEDYTYIGPSVTIVGGCKVGRLCTIGAGANILQGVSVGSGTTVAIGTTLIKSVGEDKRVISMPRIMETPK